MLNTLTEQRLHLQGTVLFGALLLLNACSQLPLGGMDLSIFGEPAAKEESASSHAGDKQASLQQRFETEALAETRAIKDSTVLNEFRHIVSMLKNKHYDEGELALVSFIQRNPESSGAHLNLGILYAGSEREEQAETCLLKAIELKPDNAVAYNQLGILYRHQHRLQDARQAFTRALEQRPDYALAHFNIGILYDIYLQKKDLAMKHYQRYQALTHGKNSLVKLWLTDLDKQIIADNSQPPDILP